MTITASWTRRVVTHAREAGLDPEPWLRTLGIDRARLDDPHGRVPFAHHAELVAQVVARLDDPGVGLDLGAGASADGFGLVSLLAQSRPRLRDALATVERFNGLANEASLMSYRVEGDRVSIRDGHYRDGRPMPPTVVEATMAFYLKMVRQTTGVASPLLELWLSHDAHRGWSHARREHVDAPVRFGAPVNALVLPAELLEAPFTSARPELSVHLETLAHHLQNELRPRHEPVTRIEAYVRDCLTRGGPEPLHVAARALGTSARTLQRQLDREGHSYRVIVDAVRRAVVEELLARPDVKHETVTRAAGYSEPRAFRRACQRWFGQSPSEYRARRR